MDSKLCTLCKETKKLSCFNKNKSRKDGLSNVCRECSRQKSRSYYNSNRKAHKEKTYKRSLFQRQKNREFIYEFLQKNPCANCGEADPVVLEFNHLRNKSNNVAYMLSEGYSIPTIKKEIEKCEVLCANCHRRKTAKDQNWYKNKQ